jgi:hypothetical protein
MDRNLIASELVTAAREIMAEDEWLTREQVADICPTCADRMVAKGIKRIRASVIEAARWEKMPKGWTDESRKKFWDTLTGDRKHKVTACIKKMKDKMDDPGAFCASLADRVDPGWRSRKKKSRDVTADINYNRFEKTLSNRAKWFVSEKYNENIRSYFPEGTDLEIITYESGKGMLNAVAFQGRAKKPLWNYYFRSESQRRKRIEDTIAARERHLERKKERQRERREFQHNLKVGDFLYTSWGYDQTNVDYYQVIKVIGKMVEIREVAKKTVRSSPPQDYVAPIKNKFVGPKMRKKVGMGDSVRIESYAHATPWDGKPKYQTSFGWGH